MQRAGIFTEEDNGQFVSGRISGGKDRRSSERNSRKSQREAKEGAAVR